VANSGRITGLTFGNQATTIRVCPATKRIASPSQKIDIVAVNAQGALQRFGCYQYAVDGWLGPMRRNALANYQRDHNLAITGAIDPQTLTSLGFIA
jgi:hypothetical protein